MIGRMVGRSLVGLLLAGMIALPSPASTPARSGIWFNAGMGYGSLGCDDCGSREGSWSGGLALGGTLSQKVLLGVGTNGWTKSEGGATLTVGTVTAVIRFYPSRTGGFFLLGGLGLGTVHVSVDGFGSDSETGGGALVGLGYDFRIGRNVSFTPFWNGFRGAHRQRRRERGADRDRGDGALGVVGLAWRFSGTRVLARGSSLGASSVNQRAHL
ncbi:MAG: hypothetical protein IPG75_20760 [Gemmatimonadetes bacterium]|nr:hypothetical protein [Gemmatimonadota bacterium]